jgi:hypothetical protein
MTPDSAFTAVVVPILREQCQGCHFPGEPMYGELPFDDYRTVSDLGDGVAVLLDKRGRQRVMEWMQLVRAARRDSLRGANDPRPGP